MFASGRRRVWVSRCAAAVWLAAFAVEILSIGGCAFLRTADPDALWKIVGGWCMLNYRGAENPAPCTTVDLAGRYAVIKDINVRAQHLLIPIDRVTGIESPEVLAEGSPEYWRYAWDARHQVQARLPVPLAPNQLGLEINSARQRSQNQLHIHIDCMRADVTAALAAHRGDPPGAWRPIDLGGHRYGVTRVMSLTGQDNPFRVVRRQLGAQQQMGDQTILVTGAGADTARQGWLIVHSGIDGERGTGYAERLMDHACTVARGA
jgi:CDP-diacylglycerol pyrophosphatase